ncbi:MAG: prepilin-type N-terminal cleavage/methylation domain-containing protein [Chthoniobacteraceae bacterium]
MHRNPNIRRRAFTLVEIMIVVAIIALLAAIAVPNFMRSRKRAQAAQVLEDLRLIDSAVDQYSLEYSKAKGTNVVWADVQLYLKPSTFLYSSGGSDSLGNAFTIPSVDNAPRVPGATFSALSDVAPPSFWSPFN